MDDFQFYEDNRNKEKDTDFRQPICVGCFNDCKECLVKNLKGAGHKVEPIIPNHSSDDNDEVFDV